MTHLLPELSVVEAEALELVLVDGAHHLHVDRRQRRLLFGELGVEVQHVLAALLQVKKGSKQWRKCGSNPTVIPNMMFIWPIHRQGCPDRTFHATFAATI